ncbi:MAG TPA: hypothetical protein EYN66_23170, partial [Myxococcales bacterium]|nr:hypothetical protein [Myxococcales bacterium]
MQQTLKGLLILVSAMVLGCSSTGEGTDGSSGTTDTPGTDGSQGQCATDAKFAADPCDPVCDVSGCAEGQICTLNGSNLVCSAPGTQKLNMGCSEDTLCEQGICVVEEGENIGKCRLFCEVDSDCGDSDYACLVTYSYKNGSVSACDIKPPPCSVYEQDCDAGMGCYLDGCLEAGTIEKGAECSTTNNCKPSLLCVSSKCHEICNPK